MPSSPTDDFDPLPKALLDDLREYRRNVAAFCCEVAEAVARGQDAILQSKALMSQIDAESAKRFARR